MSSGDASCARTRGWLWDYKKFQRPDSKSSSSDEDMSFNFDDSDKSELSSDGGYASEKDLGKDLSSLKVSSSLYAIEPNPRDNLQEDTLNANLNGDPASTNYRGTTGAPLDDSKEKIAKYKDEHRRKEKDHEKRSKRKEKSKDKLPSKESKRKKDDVDDKKSHDKHRRSEKVQKYDESEFHKKEKHRERDGERKERHRTVALDREQFRGSRHDDADEFSDHEMHRRERHWDSSRLSYHKGSTKSEREKEGKRARLDGEERVSNRARSPSPRATKGVKSPSLEDKDVEEKDWAGKEKDGSTRYRRSGLGGYSPRRRRSDAAIRTPSPPVARSPERRKTRAWDLPPVGMDSGVAAAMAAAHQAAAQQAAALASVSSLVTVNPALAAVSLTQATRNFRRLYIGNVPASVSDGELLEFINAAMLSVHAYHLPGTKPCINCMVNVEKSYAFAEFLTPEDATAGLAFDGITLHGTTLKIRRPRDYIPPPNGGVGIASVIGMVSSVVPDSPQKIFVGGICKTLSAEKVKEIVTAFGQLKAYHWEITVKNNQIEGFAFLEYLDPSVTFKACAGLNGMRLGNKILTAVQATPNASSEPDGKQAPFYGIPEHAKTLLQAPTRILEFQNVITKAEALSMSEAEFLEIEEDIRTECVRFGTVKSSHVVKPEGRPDQSTLMGEPNLGDGGSAEKLMLEAGDAYMTEVDKKIAEYIASVGGHYFQGGGNLSGGVSEVSQTDCKVITSQASSASNVSIDEGKEVPSSLSEGEGASLGVEAPHSLEKLAEDNGGNKELRDSTEQPSTESKEPSQPGLEEKAMDLEENVMDKAEQGTSTLNKDSSESIGEMGGSRCLPSDLDMLDAAADAVESLNSQIGDSDIGRVYVEFTREECACKAAHALHGRLYGDRTVIVAYFPLKMYQKRFKKGLEPRTHEERQILALAAQEHLNSYIPDRD